MKHTKGIWTTEENEHYLEVRSDEYPCYVITSGCYYKHDTATNMVGLWPEYNEVKNNIQLMASAPELLEALQLSIDTIEGLFLTESTDKACVFNAIQKAKKAILKATGGN